MMHNWFECKVRYERTCEDGQVRTVTESYLVDSLSFTEAEARIIEEVKPFVSGSFTVKAVKQEQIAELFENPKGDRWYKAKVNFVTLNEEKGIEKKVATKMMVQADTLKDALEFLADKMSTIMADWEIASISETAIMDVYAYKAKLEY